MVSKKLAHFSPGRIIFFSIFLTIILGACALWLPLCRTQPITFLDLLFTSTSATCVTGLATVPLDSFTTAGHTVILILTQIGGLGLITLTIFLMSLFVNLGFTTQLMAVKLLEFDSWTNIKKFIGFIIGFTLIIECIGALCTWYVLAGTHSWQDALFLSVFHSVTSFCNAGIDLLDGGMQQYNTNYLMLISTMLLIIIGGLGFVTWHELYEQWQHWKETKRHALSLHSKIIIYGTLLLIVIPAILIFALEYNHAFAHMSLPTAGLNALFQSVVARSAGFLSVSLGSLHLTSVFLLLMLAFIGAAPGSTASGVKITSFVVFLSTVKAAIFGKSTVTIRGRSIPKDQVLKAMAIIFLSASWIVTSLFLLLASQSSIAFWDLFVESISAFTNLGISTGITSSLSALGKLLLMLNMIIGRIGSLTLILALRARHSDKVEFSYPEERVILS
ncbi:MAG TPA: potassium transporter TrkG [Candidatus Limnocylindria bacterium]|nr:potassium transporter TrkG [Candidatus Limnocylindria bacterium]